MKQKIVVFILTMCIILLVVAPSGKAANNVCFTAINDQMQPLDNSTMPIIIGSQLYIPCNFFISDELRVYYIPGEDQDMLYSDSKKIIFYTKNDVVLGYDDNQNYIPAVKRNNLIYVPVDDICAYFGLTYDVIQSTPAPVVRFYNGKVGYTKERFISLNINKMQKYYDDYVGTTNPDTTPVSPGQPTYSNGSVYLSFYDLSAKMKSMLDTLASTPYKACFFVKADEIADNADLIRRAACKGYTIGIYLTDDTKEDAYEEYQQASALLFEAAQVKTVIITSLGSNASAVEAMAVDKSLVFWRPTKSYGAEAKFSVTNLTSKLSTISGARQSLYFACSDETAIVLPAFLSYLLQYEYNVKRITETSIPIMTASI